MTIFELLALVGSGASIYSGIDAARKHFIDSTAEDLFKNCFVEAVKQSAGRLAHFTQPRDPETVGVDSTTLDDVMTSLKDLDITTLTSLGENEKLGKITTLFQRCIILPGHELTTKALEREIQPVLEKTIADFYRQLPRNQEASNQTTFEILKAQSKVQQRLIERAQENLDINSKFSSQLADLSNKHINVSVPEAVTAAVATEHQAAIDNARDLLKKGSPISALDYFEDLKKRIWPNASPIAKFRLLTNMAAAQLVFNKEQKAAMLLLEAFQHNSEDDIALSNRAVAHFLLGETEEAEVYVQKTLEQNPVNTHAYTILVEMSSDEETIEEVIDKVPEYLRETPEIAYAISKIARQHQDFEKARKWAEVMAEHEQDDIPSCKAFLATILLDQVLDDNLAVVTEQLNDSQNAQLQRVIELFTEAWNCVVNSELRTMRTDWIINRSTAHFCLGEEKAAIKDLDTALEIEPLHPILLKNRAILAFKEGDNTSAIEFLQKIQPDSEIPEAAILLADILRLDKRSDEAIKTLNDFLIIDPPSELREIANHLLINIYIADGRFEDAQQIVTAMRESSPTSVLNLIDAARICKATGANDEALSRLKEAYDYVKNSNTFEEIIELANELRMLGQFEEAATLYEKYADTSVNSQLTWDLLNCYYHAGEREKTLGICQVLREKYGPLRHISEMEFMIYNEIGNMKQAQAVCEVYIKAFPDDIDMQIRLAVVHSRSNKFEEVDRLLEKSFDLENLILRSYLDLVYLYRIRSEPEKALDIMYEARRTYYNNSEAHLKYVGLYYTVSEKMGELLHPTQVQPGTAVCVDNSGQTTWYIVEEREDTDVTRKELHVGKDLAKRLIGKVVNDEIWLRQNPFGPEIGKITDIKSKYVYAFQEIFRTFPEMFPDTPGLWSIKLDNSHETDDSAKPQQLFDLIDKQHNVSLQIEEVYKENPLPIGALTNLTGSNVVDTWRFLMSKPDLGVRCSTRNPEERRQALTLLGSHQVKLVVDPISLMTIHSIGAADVVIKAFGKLGIAQLTIDGLHDIISDREAISLKGQAMSVGKQGDQYVRTVINPEDVRREIEYLKNIIKWIGGNCQILTGDGMLQINQLRKQEFDHLFQRFFIDTLLIASQPGHLLLSDDEPLRSYAKSNFSIEAGISCHIDGVWTQVLLEHCVNRGLLDKAKYNKMTIKLVCLQYHHTAVDADVLIEAAKQSDWQPSEPYNSLVQTLGGQRAGLSSALNVAVNFLYQLWLEPILPRQREYLALGLLDGLTSGRSPREVVGQLAGRIQTYDKFILLPLAERDIILLIQAYARAHSF